MLILFSPLTLHIISRPFLDVIICKFLLIVFLVCFLPTLFPSVSSPPSVVYLSLIVCFCVFVSVCITQVMTVEECTARQSIMLNHYVGSVEIEVRHVNSCIGIFIVLFKELFILSCFFRSSSLHLSPSVLFFRFHEHCMKICTYGSPAIIVIASLRSFLNLLFTA